MSNNQKISNLSRILLFLTAGMLIAAVYVPIWRIELDAPQYPEGLALQIHADKIAGDVDIINGLNHYIGMKTLHTEDFIEFTLITYILWAYALLSVLVMVIGKRSLLNILFVAFVLFGIVAMADFWRWEYNYGHDLNQDAAIKVPGMAYQPPLIGFKQLLNFGAYSIPDTGGWLVLASGVAMLLAVYAEFKRGKLMAAPVTVIALLIMMSGCSVSPQPINLNKDNCSFCEMTIADKRFGTELITEKGKVYKFDDMSCMYGFMKEHQDKLKNHLYAADYLKPETLMPLEHLNVVKGDAVGSPMGGNMATFQSLDSAKAYAAKWQAALIPLSEIK